VLLLLRWLYFPPVFSLILLILAALFHSREAAYSLPSVLLGAVIAAYLCLCAVSGFYISRKENAYLWSVCCLAQGVLLTAMSLHIGSTFFAWLGLVMLLVGLILVFFHATGGNRTLRDAGEDEQNAAQQNALERERTESVLGKLALPVAITDAKGVVLGATQRFADAIGKEPGDVDGCVIGDLLPPGREEITFESGTWWIQQAKEGSRYYFSLLPTPDCKPVKMPVSSPVGLSIQDLATGLYTDEYRKIRGPEEVQRAQRYRRWLSGLMLEMIYEGAERVGLSEQHREMLHNAFAQKVKASLRSMDCGFLMANKRVQVLLPETPQAGAKTLLGRLLAIPQEVFDEDVRNAVRPVVRGGLYFFNGNPPMDYNVFSAALEESFSKMKDMGDS